MTAIDEAQLDTWMRGHPQDGPGVLADLVANLVTASCPSGDARFPRRDSIGQPGFDGILVTDLGFAPFVPDGRSVWEWGAGENPKSKAKEDYEKRTEKTPEEARKVTTFVFVTPLSARRSGGWPLEKQEEWLKERKERGEWADVRLIDGTKLVAWLERMRAIKLWLAEQMGCPETEATTTHLRWETCCRVSTPSLPSSVFLARREAAGAALKEVLEGERRVLQYESHDLDEIVPFVCAYISTLPDGPTRAGAQRCIVVHTPAAWTYAARLPNPHVIVAEFSLNIPEGLRLLQEAKACGHGVVYHAAGGIAAQGRVPLPQSSPHDIERQLRAAGFAGEQARKLAVQSAGRPALLLRILTEGPINPATAASPHANRLAVATLLGQWCEDHAADIAVANAIANDPGWQQGVRDASQETGAVVTHEGARWRIASKEEAWATLGSRIFDDHLTRFRAAAIATLRERDPQFDLPPEERFAAAIHGKKLAHSYQLRQGLAETLALLAARPDALSSTTRHFAESTARVTVREVLKDADWVLWASLQKFLPLLAEAAPSEFLDGVEAALARKPCPFDEIFAQEDTGVFGRTYTSGLLWALEGLAWEPTIMPRVALVLAELATRDPGGNWANRPKNSLRAIFRPWLPQTAATIEQRMQAVKAIVKEHADVGWDLLMGLLPRGHDVASSTHRPTWRAWIPAEWKDRPSVGERNEQFRTYAAMAVEASAIDSSKLASLIERFDDLPDAQFEGIVAHIESGALDHLSEESCYGVWISLINLITRHRKFADAIWAMPAERTDRLDRAAERIAPMSARLRNRRLFIRSEYELYDEKGSYDEQRRRLDEKRQKALADMVKDEGLSTTLDFACEVEAPEQAGWALGIIGNDDTDAVILPKLLASKDARHQMFARTYAHSRRHAQGWAWLDGMNLADWTPEQKAKLLTAIPFSRETWERAAKLLADQEGIYWTTVEVHAYGVGEGLVYAAEKLAQHGRPKAAIQCLKRLEHSKTPYDRRLAVRILLAALGSDEPANLLWGYALREIIKGIQEDAAVDDDTKLQVEFAYIVILDRDDGARPIILERRLATTPEFFCELIRRIYRSKTEAEPRVLDDQQKRVVQAAYALLSRWGLVPGTQPDGTLDAEDLSHWVDMAKKYTINSGHFEVAMIHLGEVLTHAPPDPDGLWIHRAAAEILNARWADDVRTGFQTQTHNSRGTFAFTAETAGQEERALAAKYRKQADELEAAGFLRAAIPLRELADDYERQAGDMERERFFDL